APRCSGITAAVPVDGRRGRDLGNPPAGAVVSWHQHTIPLPDSRVPSRSGCLVRAPLLPAQHRALAEPSPTGWPPKVVMWCVWMSKEWRSEEHTSELQSRFDL